MLDHLLTTWTLSQVGTEVNPVMAIVMAQPIWVSFTIKNVWTALMLVIMYLLAKRIPGPTRLALFGIMAIYLGVIGYHIWGITMFALLS